MNNEKRYAILCQRLDEIHSQLIAITEELEDDNDVSSLDQALSGISEMIGKLENK